VKKSCSVIIKVIMTMVIVSSIGMFIRAIITTSLKPTVVRVEQAQREE